MGSAFGGLTAGESYLTKVKDTATGVESSVVTMYTKLPPPSAVVVTSTGAGTPGINIAVTIAAIGHQLDIYNADRTYTSTPTPSLSIGTYNYTTTAGACGVPDRYWVRTRVTIDLPRELPVKGAALKQFILRSYVPFVPAPLSAEIAAAIAKVRGPLEMAPTVNLPAPSAVMPGLALVGDAAGCSHPITASGMTMGLRDAECLGEEARRRHDAPVHEAWLDDTSDPLAPPRIVTNYLTEPDDARVLVAGLKILRDMATGSTVHGFRSAFRDWVADMTSYPGEVAEAALAHVNSNKVEAAYRRTDFLEKRKALMAEWAVYCCGG